MKQMTLRKVAIAASTFACAALLAPDWSNQSGVSLSVRNAEARIGNPLTPLSVAGVARRQVRRSAYGVGLGLAGTGAYYDGANAPYYYGSSTPYYGSNAPYYGSEARYYGSNAPYAAPVYGHYNDTGYQYSDNPPGYGTVARYDN